MIMAQSVHCVCFLNKLSNSKSYSTSVLTIKPCKMEPKSSKSPEKKKSLCHLEVLYSQLFYQLFQTGNLIIETSLNMHGQFDFRLYENYFQKFASLLKRRERNLISAFKTRNIYKSMQRRQVSVWVQNRVSIFRKLIGWLMNFIQTRDCGIRFCFGQTIVLVTSVVSRKQLLQDMGGLGSLPQYRVAKFS